MTAPLVLLAAPVLEPGYGVATVVRAQREILRGAGYRTCLVALRAAQGDLDPGVIRSGPWPVGLSSVAAALGARLAILHGPPFLGRIPVGARVPALHWEHGLVLPEALPEPEARRARAQVANHARVARNARATACPSRFLSDRLGILARVIPNGADHLAIPRLDRTGSRRNLLTVLRTGRLEDLYKGLPDLLELPMRLGDHHPWRLRAVVSGPGDAQARLERAGWSVVRSPTTDELARLYAEADAYLAPSRCESFDLPLVEAQRAGAAGLALRAGAHAETCPHLYSSTEEAAAVLSGWDQLDLSDVRDRSLAFTRALTWENHGRALLDLVGSLAAPAFAPDADERRRAALSRLSWRIGAVLYSVGRTLMR